jgi:phenylalanyl-tRNA synthetase beta chain
MKQKEKKSLELLEGIIKELNEKLGVEMKGLIESTEAGVIFETDFTALVEKLPDPIEDDIVIPKTVATYKPISIYPFSSRDIAVFVPEGVTEQELLDIIVKESGSLLVRHGLFDVFKKPFPDGTSKTSYAFRLVFQSFERTLTDDEINDIMHRITSTMNSQNGWQVR